MLENIKTIVLLMFENRSFDHMLGHLSYDGINTAVDGLTSPLSQYVNTYNTVPYNPFRLKADTELPKDLPHEMTWVAEQMDKSPANGQYLMDGFVKAYFEFTKLTPGPKPDPMGFFNAAQIPITSFLASTYCTCNRWFSALPTSTQPNRTMAFCGDTAVDSTKFQAIPATGNMFDWLDNVGEKGVKWRVYHDGISIFILYPGLWDHVFSDKFKRYESFYDDFKNESDDTFPQVIVIEPSYHDGPHFGSDQPNDNHPPLAVGFGEEFLRRTYEAVIGNASRWGNTLLVVYYDEHGGFFDHVPPLPMAYTVKNDAATPFQSLGVRVPAMLISPYVTKGSVTNLLLDHTSVLQLLAEKFTPGVPYSDTVNYRKTNGINSLSALLSTTQDLAAPDPPAAPIMAKAALGDNVALAPEGAMGQAFESAALDMMAKRADDTRRTYPELTQWKDVMTKARAEALQQSNA